ncbi:MAG: exo-alpha-sialidase [Armatimonadota bacterium]
MLYPRSHGPERGYHACVVAERSFEDLEITAELRRSPGVTHFGLVFRYQDDRNLYRLVLRSGQEDFRVERVIDGVSDYATTRHVPFDSRPNEWYHVRLRAVGPEVRVWIDGALMYEGGGFDELKTGAVGVTVFDPALAEFDDFEVRSPRDGSTLFEDSFDDEALSEWVAVGPPDVKGEWAVQDKVERQPPAREFEVISEFQVCPPTGRNRSMFEFPSLLAMDDGRLFTVFIEENQHGTPPWAAMPGSGRLWCAWSDDMGESWTSRRLFVDTPIDDRHCYVTQLPGGRLLATFWVQLVAFGTRGVINYATTSDDGGVTWSDPVRWGSPHGGWAPEGMPQVAGSSSVTVPAHLAPDGRLYQAVATVGHDGRPPPEAGLVWSSDGGRTWGDYVTVAFDPERRISYVEPAILRLSGGRWVCVMRTEVPITPGTTHPYRLGPTMWCTSEDGQVWSEPEEMPLDFTRTRSTAPYLLETQTGVVVFAVNAGTAFSYDGARTWVTQDIELGYYPVMAEVAPGTIASLACGMRGNVIRLTRPEPGADPPEAPASAPTFPEPAELTEAEATPPQVREVLERPAVIRVRGALAQGRSPLVRPDDWPLLAAFPARTASGYAVVGLRSDGVGTRWGEPFTIAECDGPASGVALDAARDGTILLCFSAGAAGDATAYVTRSDDGGTSWEPAVALSLPAGYAAARTSAPPVSADRDTWLLPLTAADDDGGPSALVLRSTDGGASWEAVSELPEALAEPALTVVRDGRWLALAQRAGSDEIVQCVSRDGGGEWSEPAPIGLRGTRPSVVELLEDLFIAAAEGPDGHLAAAVAWDDLAQWLPNRLACGHLVRVAGEKHIGRGCGVDLAGSWNRISQVPLDPEEVARAEAAATRLVSVDDAAFELEGEWERVEDERGVRVLGRESATASVHFTGTGVVLLHGRRPDGHLVRVTIDGNEYPPVETRGTEQFPVRTAVAVDLEPGEHEMTLAPLLHWQSGSISIGGVDVLQSK